MYIHPKNKCGIEDLICKIVLDDQNHLELNSWISVFVKGWNFLEIRWLLGLDIFGVQKLDVSPDPTSHLKFFKGLLSHPQACSLWLNISYPLKSNLEFSETCSLFKVKECKLFFITLSIRGPVAFHRRSYSRSNLANTDIRIKNLKNYILFGLKDFIHAKIDHE